MRRKRKVSVPKSITVPGEKTVKPTEMTVPVKREHLSAENRKPTPPEALDRREQIVQTDQS